MEIKIAEMNLYQLYNYLKLLRQSDFKDISEEQIKSIMQQLDKIQSELDKKTGKYDSRRNR